MEALEQRAQNAEAALASEKEATSASFSFNSPFNHCAHATIHHRRTRARRRTRTLSDDEPPAELLCAINRHILRDPVRTPYGDVFERETIETWLQTLGSVCPLTHEPLTLDDLEPDVEIAQRAMAYRLNGAVNARRDSE